MTSMATNNVQLRYDLKTPEHDHRLYRGLLLTNEMKVILISDPSITKAAVSLDVNIGYFSDPDDLPGLANLCQKMLTLGTQECFEYKRFHKFVSAHNGIFCGMTESTNTNYYLEIDVSLIAIALWHYAQFFLTPLFKEDWIEKEVNDIEMEHKYNLENDNDRLIEFIKAVSKSDHPYSKFASGNEETLRMIPKNKGIDVRHRLLEFYDKYYSANIMSLCFVSNETLDEIEKMVVNIFCQIRNKKIDIPIWYEQPLKDQFCTKWYIVPKENIRNLEILFPLPEMRDDYWLPAVDFIIALLQHEGKGSLVSTMRIKDWSNNMMIYKNMYAKGINFLHLKILMTKNGILYIDFIIELLFKFINMLTNKINFSTSFRQEMQRLLKKFVDLNNNKFEQFKFCCGDVMTITKWLHEYPMEKVLLKKIIHYDWESQQDIIMWILKNFISPQNMRVYVLLKEYKDIAHKYCPKWSDIKYKEEKITEETINTWKKSLPSSELNLPLLDKFLV